MLHAYLQVNAACCHNDSTGDQKEDEAHLGKKIRGSIGHFGPSAGEEGHEDGDKDEGDCRACCAVRR
jgi:hypothetical protein